jgi:hypothetical protein
LDERQANFADLGAETALRMGQTSDLGTSEQINGGK